MTKKSDDIFLDRSDWLYCPETWDLVRRGATACRPDLIRFAVRRAKRATKRGVASKKRPAAFSRGRSMRHYGSSVRLWPGASFGRPT